MLTWFGLTTEKKPPRVTHLKLTVNRWVRDQFVKFEVAETTNSALPFEENNLQSPLVS